MITRKLHIKSCSDSAYIKRKQENYSYAFRRLYKMLDSSTDGEFIAQFKETFDMKDIEYRSLVMQIKSFKEKELTTYKEKERRIANLDKRLAEGNMTDRQVYKAYRTIRLLSAGIGRESTFGGRTLQQQLTRECNKTGEERSEEKIQQLRNEFKENRVLPFCVVGEANEKGNRFFDFSRLTEGIIIYKPQKPIKIAVEVKVPKRFREELSKLAEMTQAKAIPVSVTMSCDGICLTFDEEALNGYALNKKDRNAEVREVKAQHIDKETQSALIKDIYKKYYDEQRERKAFDKIKDRVLVVDLNPECIGYSILDKTVSGVKVVHCGLISFKKLMAKTHKSSDSAESKYRNNKHKYEVTMAVKCLFRLIAHYKCSGFVMEKLEFDAGSSDKSTEVNRKTRNLWYRTTLEGCIRRRCNETGVELITVNPCYSSFIGNIQNGYADATNASIEIGRRGLYKYTNGGFYPQISEDDIHTLEAKFGDVVECSTADNWVAIYKSLVRKFKPSEFAQRLRTRISQVQCGWESFSMSSCKSMVIIITFH